MSKYFFENFPIPGNDDARRSIDLYCNLLKETINNANKDLPKVSEVKTENEDKEDNYTRREFSFTSFKRAFTLPDTVDGSKIDAKYEDGILKLTLPKKQEALPKPKRMIEIG